MVYLFIKRHVELYFYLLQRRGGKKCLIQTRKSVHAGSVGLKPIKKVSLKKWRVGSSVSWNAVGSTWRCRRYLTCPMGNFLRGSFRHTPTRVGFVCFTQHENVQVDWDGMAQLDLTD
ncbi:hypothetical protein EVAR_7321_1 [Eumeta japonica]|uniref:Uncharacterized protein n=1 Tax=Eumeta variegata TaxID=151549 RepID=A0A4C1T5N1_EUMVA|nr:hypothetical protein EVAR_7321_1 [Eumeta japonica]